MIEGRAGQPRVCQRRLWRKADGVMPTALLNTVAKYVGEAKPQAAAVMPVR